LQNLTETKFNKNVIKHFLQTQFVNYIVNNKFIKSALKKIIWQFMMMQYSLAYQPAHKYEDFHRGRTLIILVTFNVLFVSLGDDNIDK